MKSRSLINYALISHETTYTYHTRPHILTQARFVTKLHILTHEGYNACVGGFVLWTEMLPQGLKSLVGANKTKRKRIETSSVFIVALLLSNDPSN